MSLYRELQRRNVLRVAAGYIAVAWLILQVMDTLSDAFELTGEHMRVTVIVLAVCFIPTLIISWAFELTPDGLKRDAEVERGTPAAKRSAKRLDRLVMAALAIALAYFVIDELFFETPPLSLTEAERSIAVLPFVNMSSDPEQEFFSDGISEEMLNLLAQIPGLRVISRTSAFQYKDTDKEIPVIADELRVAHVLEGSVRKAGNTIRITAQLIHGPTDAHVWSETWDRELDDIFAIQDEIAALVVSRLRVELVGEAPQVEGVDPEAYVLYLEAEHFMSHGAPGMTRDETKAHVTKLLERVLEIEPDYVDALTAMSLNLWRQWDNTAYRRLDDPLILRSEEMLDRALAIDPNDPSVLAFGGYSRALQPGGTADAATLFARALASGPTDEDALRLGLLFARSIGRYEVGIRIGEFRTSRSPRCAVCFYQLSQVYRDAGMLDKAEEAGRIAYALGYNLEFSIARTNLFQGDPAPLIAFYRDDFDENWQSVSYLAMALYSAGRIEESDVWMAKMVETYADRRPFEIAAAFAWRGDADEAFEWLERSLVKDRADALFTIQSPEFRPIHDDPRWDEFLRKIGRHPNQLAEIRFDPKIPDF